MKNSGVLMMAFLFHGPWCLDFDERDVIGGDAEVFIMYSLTGKLQGSYAVLLNREDVC